MTSPEPEATRVTPHRPNADLPDEQTRTRDTVVTAPDSAPPVAGYELAGEIARGGMGVVYRARDASLEREVAVKVMRPGMSAAEFVRESRITARLPHPGIPPVYALGTLPDGRPFLAMKLIGGDTLDRLLRARPDAAADRGSLLAVFEQISHAVGYAHSKGIIHRDLKPHNVMVGQFGEVQVMDWGLAKSGVGGQGSGDSEESVAATRREADAADATQAGQIKGTPAYMAPEQARGEPVDCRADVFALGGILTAILTGRAPFGGTDVLDTIRRAAQADLSETFARLDACGADGELVALAKRCLAAKAADRPSDGTAVTAAVASYRAGVDTRLRRAEQDAAAAEVRAAEQKKRRRVQLALAGVVAAALVGAAAAAVLVTEQRAADKLAAEQQRGEERVAAEKKLADERVAAEAKRQADLKTADESARRRQRQTRADALVQALVSADTAGVPRVLADLADVRDLAHTRLFEHGCRALATKPGLHARLALLPDEPPRAAELAAYLPDCRPDELLTIRDALKPHAAAVSPGLWTVLLDPKADGARRVRAAGALAALAPDDERWATVAPDVAAAAVRASAAEFVVWSRALEPVGGELVPPLLTRYPQARGRIEGGRLAVSELAAEVSGYDLTAALLARYANQPADLAELALLADARHYPLFAPAMRANRAVVPLLKAELAKAPPADLAVDKLDAALEASAKRRGYAAAALVALGESESAWQAFRLPKDGDPTARSYLTERLAQVKADPRALVARFDAEPDVSAKRALLLALGDFPPALVPDAERAAFTRKLLALYRDHPDPGLHGAIDWLLRQQWDAAKELASVDAELTAQARGRVAARAVADAAIPVGVSAGVVGALAPAPTVTANKDWFVSGEGQTFAVVRGPVEYLMGSPLSEPARIENDEHLHPKRIARTFAVATKEVTVEQFLRFRPKHEWLRRYSPGPDTPAVSVMWYDAAAYCNWLSEREGIPPHQWCYEPNADGQYAEGMRMKPGHLALTGYRLPTEAEWEFACRAGAVTSRHYGRGEELLPRYARFLRAADERAHPTGRLRPNDSGLFDALGNALEWCEDPGYYYTTAQREDVENAKTAVMADRLNRLLRGGSFFYLPADVRCAARLYVRPNVRNIAYGFRPVRTLP